MKKIWMLFLISNLFIPMASAQANLTPPITLGIDFSQPYTLTVDGDKITQRNNVSVGADARYFINDNINIGLRVATDLEDQSGSVRKTTLSPGIQYHWFQGETWMPFARFDTPIVLHGAANGNGKESQKDLGLALGFGLAWNLGKAIGIENMIVRYDFSFFYQMGLQDALNLWAIEFFKVGLEYRF